METELHLLNTTEADELTALLLKQLRQEITDGETRQLNDLVAKHPSYKRVYERINNEEQLLADLLVMKQVDKQGWWQKISEQTVARAKPRSFFRRWSFYVAAAVMLIIAALTYRFVITDRLQKGANEKQVSVKINIPPGGNKATLTLANGSVINLDYASTGTVAEENNTRIVKLKNGELKYEPVSQDGSIEHTGNQLVNNWNVLSTPVGGQYRLVLPDGSKVWLNAASSIKYPTHFTGNVRRVAITGEAWFEVSHVKGAPVPFVVSINSPSGGRAVEVEVLGTEFNINAYPDEDAIKTTLLKGKIKVFVFDGAAAGSLLPDAEASRSKQLTAGQQAQIPVITKELGSDSIKVVNGVDTELAIAWKNGLHSFKNADIKTIMRMLGRWYNIEIGYEGKIPDYKFTGSIPRTENFSAVLNMLEYAGIHFRIEEKKIVVVP